MYDNYSTLIAEVRTTNDLIEEQTQRIDTLESNLITYIIVIAIILCADMVHHILDATYKRK